MASSRVNRFNLQGKMSSQATLKTYLSIGAGKVAQGVKLLATKPDKPSSIPRAYMVKEEPTPESWCLIRNPQEYVSSTTKP